MLEMIIYVCAIILVLSMAYQLVPHRVLRTNKPMIALFPKYHFKYDSKEKLITRLNENNFAKHNASSTYARGYFFGDFSLKLAKMNVKLDEVTKTAYIHSPLIVILFDTGDTWKLAQKLSQ